MKRTEIKGNRYGKWVALWEYEYRMQPNGRNVCYELCRCDCGTVRYVKRSSLTEWKSRWCECYRESKEYRDLLSEISKWKNTKHWFEGTPFYRRYRDILSRCNNKNCKAYKNYGGRWIKCLWKNFEEFYNDMYDSYLEHCERFGEKETTIDRINNNGDYCKKNCRWATYKEQGNNTRMNIKTEYKGILYGSLQELCDKLWLKYGTIWKRLKSGWDLDKVIDLYN